MWLPYRQNPSKCCCNLWKDLQWNQWGFSDLCPTQKRVPSTSRSCLDGSKIACHFSISIFHIFHASRCWTPHLQDKPQNMNNRQLFQHETELICWFFWVWLEASRKNLKSMVIFDYVLLTSAKTFLTTKGTTSRVHEIRKISPSCWCLIHRNLHYFCHSGKHTIKHHMIKTVLFLHMVWGQLRNILGLVTSPDRWARSIKKKSKTKNRSTPPFWSKLILVSAHNFKQNPGMFIH